VHGAVAAVKHVLPDMLARRSWTIIITTGASSVSPHLGHTNLANVALATAGLRTRAYALPAAVASKGVQVGHVAIGGRLWRQPGPTPEAVAPLYWGALHAARSGGEGLPAGSSERPINPTCLIPAYTS